MPDSNNTRGFFKGGKAGVFVSGPGGKQSLDFPLLLRYVHEALEGLQAKSMR
jgi:hypothetical protein